MHSSFENRSVELWFPPIMTALLVYIAHHQPGCQQRWKVTNKSWHKGKSGQHKIILLKITKICIWWHVIFLCQRHWCFPCTLSDSSQPQFATLASNCKSWVFMQHAVQSVSYIQPIFHYAINLYQLYSDFYNAVNSVSFKHWKPTRVNWLYWQWFIWGRFDK